MSTETTQLPAAAVQQTGADLTGPTAALLRGLMLLGTEEDMKKASGLGSAFAGPPDSVALIEAGATAAAKWWAAGLSAAAVTVTGAVRIFWTDNAAIQGVLVISLGVAVAAAVLAVGYILGSDLRGRADAAVAVIRARSDVARSVTVAAQQLYTPPPATDALKPPVVPLPDGLQVTYAARPAADEQGWRAIAMRENADGVHFLLVKAGAKEWASGDDVVFV